MKEVLLVTGGAGFIGSNFIHMILNKTEYDVINFDSLTYAGNLENLKDIQTNGRYRFIRGDIAKKDMIESVLKKFSVSGIINFAAESHVDRSILNASEFIDSNIKGTLNILECVRDYSVKKFLQISTDEVYGDLAEGKDSCFTENTNLKPNSPYSASKASADLLAMAFRRTHNIPVKITRCSNNYGPYQFPEKLIPLVIYNALNNKKLPVYGDGQNIRDWIYVDDHCRGVLAVYEEGIDGEIYNIGSRNEWKNIDIIKRILDELNMDYSLIEYVKDRPGHDRHYAIDPKKIETELKFTSNISLESGIKRTVKWYLENADWVKNCIDGSYMKYYESNYKNKMEKG